MKYTIFFVILMCVSLASFAQSDAFSTVRKKFRGQEGVFHLSASGFFARTVLGLAGEHEFKRSIRNMRSIRVMTIPAVHFRNANVTVRGMEKLVIRDSFEEAVRIIDHGDEVALFVKESGRKRNNRYFVVIEDKNEVLLMEIRGYIDTEMLKRNSVTNSNRVL